MRSASVARMKAFIGNSGASRKANIGCRVPTGSQIKDFGGPLICVKSGGSDAQCQFLDVQHQRGLSLLLKIMQEPQRRTRTVPRPDTKASENAQCCMRAALAVRGAVMPSNLLVPRSSIDRRTFLKTTALAGAALAAPAVWTGRAVAA